MQIKPHLKQTLALAVAFMALAPSVLTLFTMIKMKFHPILCLFALLPAAVFAWEKDKPATPPVIPPNPNNLPKVLLIGDSISGGYQDAALQVMKKHEVQVNDLYALLKPRRSEFQADDNVHFSGAGSSLMARQVANCILNIKATAGTPVIPPLRAERDAVMNPL